MLEKRGLIERDAENAWLSSDPSLAGPLDDLTGSSVTHRIAVGPRTGQKVFTLRTVPAQGEDGEGRNGASQAGGFSLLEIVGTNIRAFVSGDLKIQTTDATLSGGGSNARLMYKAAADWESYIAYQP